MDSNEAGEKMDKATVGRIGEDIAVLFLERRGYKVVERNYRKPWGEIDIIAKKGNSIRFVEVKTLAVNSLPDVSRESPHYRPEEQVHPKKLQKLARTAELYMISTRNGLDFQIDVVGVFLESRTRKARCRLFEQVL
ncbi:MAG: YraN family protein [Candidatus Pacebacteria bacterium]|nr:YraN family protein [Candidatus Paceibacterota bacterium]